MARRILFVEATNLARDPDKELFVDAHVDVDWKVRMAIDDWSGDIQTAPPTFKVRPFETYASEFNEYGILSDPTDVAWLTKAMTKPRGDQSYEAIKLLARVNELNVRNAGGRRGFKIEVMTGEDVENYLAAGKRAAAVGFIAERWWQIGLVIAAVWLWFWLG